ncbi:MAG: hypothetical protein COA65_09770 [Rhodospirillaceae bacterium]|nr:MAG: hypothetical protein COA65_09770 [Rhodospirillaceae bacterium]
MKITLESTTKIVELSRSEVANGLPARIWEGETEQGIKVHVYITRIACDEDEPRKEQFERDLQSQRKPSAPVAAIPLRMIV